MYAMYVHLLCVFIQISLQKYYSMCNPQRCVYTRHGRMSALDLLTSTLGLLGGLSVVARLVATAAHGDCIRLGGGRRPNSTVVPGEADTPGDTDVTKFVAA